MKQEFEYIDDYFKGLLKGEERKIFEQRLVDEPGFAEEVAFYVSAHGAARDLVHEEKRNRFREIPVQSFNNGNPVIRKWLPYVAAAVFIGVIILVSLFYFTGSSPKELPHQLAHQYVAKEFTRLGVPMSTAGDSLQQGINLYNEGKPEQLQQALIVYEHLIQNDSANNLALKYAGLVSLRLKQYDSAFAYFQSLANIPDLFSNPGKFYSAITILERNRPEDIPRAKKLLQEVVRDNLEGRETAEEWLKRW